METNRRIREEIARQNITMTDLAKMSGLNRSTISRYCSDKVEPKPEAITAIAKALKVSPGWLMGLNESKENVPQTVKPVKLSLTEIELIADFRACSSEDKLNLIECVKRLREKRNNGNT